MLLQIFIVQDHLQYAGDYLGGNHEMDSMDILKLSAKREGWEVGPIKPIGHVAVKFTVHPKVLKNSK